MKNVFLSAIMVAVSFMATAQTMSNPVSYDDFSEANMYEWFTLSDRPGEIISYGDSYKINIFLIDFFEDIKLDINKPNKEDIDENGDIYKTWVFYNKYGEFMKLTIIEDSEFVYIMFREENV